MSSENKDTASSEDAFQLLKIGGISVPPFPIFLEKGEKQFEDIRNLKCRESDIFLLAHGKCGTHWVWEIANMLVRGTTEYRRETKEFAMLENMAAEDLDKIESPRILNSHLYYHHMPKEFFDKGGKAIFMVRNPKDVIVSGYNHATAQMRPDGTFSEKPWNDFFQVLFAGEDALPYGGFFKYVRHWEKVMDEHPELPLHMVFYEDMKQDPIKETKRLAKFLGATCDDAMIAEITDKCSFAKLKKANDNEKDDTMIKTMSRDGKTSFMYRKGEVGDWKNWFTVQQNEAFDAFYEKEMKGSKLKFTYAL